MSRLLSLYVRATQELYRASQTFLGDHTAKVPFIIGLAGSVAVGKSTTARILQALLSRWPGHPAVDLVTTDGFLFPNAVLTSRGIMHRKGFPDSYDRAKLVRFLADLKAGAEAVDAPVYSHQRYDIVPGASHTVRHPDIVIVEGLNVLQAPPERAETQMFASDFFDFTIYVDADEQDIQRWYVERFLRLRDTVFQDPQSYFHRYAALDEAAGARHRRGHLERDQRREPAREHRAHAHARQPDSAQERESRRGAGAAAAAVVRRALRAVGIDVERPAVPRDALGLHLEALRVDCADAHGSARWRRAG